MIRPFVLGFAAACVAGLSCAAAQDIEHAYTKIDLKACKHTPGRIAEAAYWGIRVEYPRLERVAVRVIFDPQVLAREARVVREEKEERRRIVAAMTEESVDEFCACIECRPFSLVHTCILTPSRLPMCAARTYASVKAAAHFGSAQLPWKRQGEKDLPMRLVFKKGRVLDAKRGEYEGCNQVYRQLTGGQLERVYLDSLRDHPHTSCGCFQNLAFWIDEVQGIGIMSRDAQAVAPTGETWAMLANRAGGKQSPGIMGVSLAYIRSPQFLRGDGGIGNVVWVDSVLHGRIAKHLLAGQRVEIRQHAIGHSHNLVWRHPEEADAIGSRALRHGNDGIGMARRPAGHGPLIQTMQWTKCLGIAQKRQIMHGSHHPARPQQGTYIDRSVHQVHALAQKGPRLQPLFPEYAQGRAISGQHRALHTPAGKGIGHASPDKGGQGEIGAGCRQRAQQRQDVLADASVAIPCRGREELGVECDVPLARAPRRVVAVRVHGRDYNHTPGIRQTTFGSP